MLGIESTQLARAPPRAYVLDMEVPRPGAGKDPREPAAPRTLDITPSGAVRSEAAPAAESAPPSPSNAPAASFGITARRKALAFVIAAISDAISVGTVFTPPAQIAVDAVTAALLFWVLGFRWQLLPALAAEAIPVVSAFPTWTLAVGVLIGVTPTARAR